jgi:NAD(P)-dependent dehydrogenase (short-subunit alcohol dehydrogenase family)
MPGLDRHFSLAGQVAMVTGAASGLGAEIAVAMAEAGAEVACLDLDDAGLARTAAAVREAGREALTHNCDVTAETEVTAAVAAAVSRFGRLDVLFNNAGVVDRPIGPLHESTTETWRAVLDVNLDGVYFCAREALKVMTVQGSGKVVNIGSMWGLAGAANVVPLAAYTAAKGAVVNLTRELGLQYAEAGIQVNALCPGFFATKLGNDLDLDLEERRIAYTPMRRVAAAVEIRGPAIFLASPASDYMTGQTLVVDGGCLAG